MRHKTGFFDIIIWQFMFVINPELCTQCEECVDACPCGAIIDKGKYSEIDQEACADCGACLDVCEFGAISEVEGNPGQIPSKKV